MAESREKSEQLRKQFEGCVTEASGGAIGALLDRCSNPKFADEYACSDVQMAWGAFQFGEEIGREAGRRDALEEAKKILCSGCRGDWPLSAKLPNVHLLRDNAVCTCSAAAIRALLEKP